jgi:CBS domain containing-hemolysin-like protein
VIVLGLIAIPFLIAINGYFVAVEFALVAVRKTRVEEMLGQGVRGARAVSKAFNNLNNSIAAAQLGITLASIALGAVGESVLAKLLEPLLTFVPENLQFITRHSLATLASIAVITYLHVILGEQVPKMMAIQSSDRVALWCAPPLNVFARVTSPILRLMSATGNFLLRRLGYETGDSHEAVHSVEELRMLVEDTEEAGLLQADQAVFVKNVFMLTDKKVRDCMVPVEKMDAIEIHTKPAKVLQIVRACGHTRLPVYDGNRDNIVGILNTKHLFSIITLGHVVILEDALYPATYIDPDESIGIGLKLFRKSRKPMAIVRDADKKVHGMITLEDVIEEIVGDIEDEHDAGGPKLMQRRDN